MAFQLESVRVTQQQFLGIEVNPRAAAIAELVLAPPVAQGGWGLDGGIAQSGYRREGMRGTDV